MVGSSGRLRGREEGIVSDPAPVAEKAALAKQAPVTERVLFVDDEPNVLEAIKRSLHKRFAMDTAASGAEGLRLLSEAGPFGLVVSDMRMPSMNGAQFLAKVREQSPDTVRMILSGQSDFQSTVAAVNDGHIYRFLCKPCPPDKLIPAVEDGLNQHRLITAEKVLLEQTLSGSIKMLIEILGMVSPSASSRASRLQRYVLDLATALALPPRWQWSTAAYISQIGCVTLPKEILTKVDAAQALSDEESRLYESHPEIAEKLLAPIPRLEDIAAIVRGQFGALDFSGKSEDISHWDVRSVGELLLRTSVEFDRLVSRGTSREAAVEALRVSKLGLPPSVIKALPTLKLVGREFTHRQVKLKELMPGMILDEDLVSLKGIRLIPSGQEVTRTVIVRLTSIADGVGVAEPFRVRVPA
jgi:response regulator RpfG family c-di-GMP phosphodiesterase